MSKQPILIGRQLFRRYGDVVAVGGVDIEVRAAEVVGLLGANGAGKSTTFKLLAGLERADSGVVVLDGEDVTSLPLHRRAKRGLGYLPQHSSLMARLTVRQNLELALEAAGYSKSGATGILEGAGLLPLADQLANSLSGGQRRRLEVARCLAIRPKVVLMDEPFAGVDPAHVKALQQTVRQLAVDGVAVLITDHAVRETLPICDRAYILDSGAIQVHGTPTVVANDPVARSRYLGNDFELLPMTPLHS